MDAERTGNLINFLRTKMGLTQKELAAQINVSDKAVSKWERGDGCPDIGILPALAQSLECDVDSLIKGELPSTTPRKELTEEEVQALLAASTIGEEMKTDLSLLSNPGPRIKIYDFKRPDLFNKFQLRKIANIFEMLCEKVAMELVGNRKDLLGLKLVSVDQLTNEEFIRSLPERTFFYSYDYDNSGFALEIDPEIGKVLLKHDLKKYPELTQTDADCLHLSYINNFSSMMQQIIYENTNKSLSYQDFSKALTVSSLLPRSLGQNPNSMCLLVTLALNSDLACGMINIQFNYSYFSNLSNKLGFFGDPNQGPKLCQLSDIKNKPVENNLFVEFGRFSPDNVLLEPGSILLSSKRAGEPLNVIIDEECRFLGEVVAVEENFGIRIVSASNNIKYDEEHYLALRLGAAFHSQEGIAKIQEGTVLQLDSLAGNPISVILDGKTVARGEVVIVDDFYGVRLLD